MPVTVIDRIVPKNNGAFPVVGDEHFLGGFRIVADAAARDAIPSQRRTVGMWVKTRDDLKMWTLVGGTGNANWQEVIFATGETPIATLEPLTVPVDYNDPTAVDPPAGTTFARQTEIDTFLASHGATWGVAQLVCSDPSTEPAQLVTSGALVVSESRKPRPPSVAQREEE
jgi:hypothetical protein